MTLTRTAAAAQRSAAVPPAVADESQPRSADVTVRDRGRVPHWERGGATYFVTFRLADSLPKSVLETIESERHSVIATANQMHRPLSADERNKLQRLSTKTIEEYLDRGVGACHLANPALADELASAQGVIHSWKSFTAKRCNRLLNADGTFWQREYYDRIVRNECEMERVLGYVSENPAKSGLRVWRWVWVSGQDAPMAAAGHGGATK